jgi:hypothetical protein
VPQHFFGFRSKEVKSREVIMWEIVPVVEPFLSSSEGEIILGDVDLG